jgi:PKD repeat protein
MPIATVSLGTELNGYGWANYTQQVFIEPWAKNGTATIYANVFTDWPKNNGYPLCPEKAATFAILESDYDESTPKGVPPQAVQNGTYHVFLRLSPEPKPGLYIVYATAFYAGFHPDVVTAASFQVVNVASPPRASFVIKPPRATINYDITFDAGSSTPEGYNETITNYKWSFGDTQTGTGKIIHHQYTSYGNYTVTLNVTDSDPHAYWNTTTRKAVIKLIHNVAVLNMSSLNVVFNEWKAPVGVTVKNRGTVPETFNVTLYVNLTHYAGRIRFNNLAAYATNTTTITWDTTGYTPLRNGTLKVVADTIPGELTTTDNSVSWGAVQIRLLGDLYFDRKIDVLDLVRVTGIYGYTSATPGWDILTDLYRDDKIDIIDVVKITGRYGQRY